MPWLNDLTVHLWSHHRAVVVAHVIAGENDVDQVGNHRQRLVDNGAVNFYDGVEQGAAEFRLQYQVGEPVLEAAQVLGNMHRARGQVENDGAVGLAA